MKFEDIAAPCLSLRVKEKSKGLKEEGLTEEPVLDLKTLSVRGEFAVRTEKFDKTVIPANAADVNELTNAIVSGRAMLARLTNRAPDGSAELQIILFNGVALEMGDIEIGVDETTLESVEKISKKATLEDVSRYIWGQSVFKYGGKSYFFLVAGEAAKSYLEAKSDDDTNDTSEETKKPPVKRAFALLGADIRFALAEKDNGNGKTVFCASGITRIRNHREDPALRLACGDLKFVDWTTAGERAFQAKAQLDKLTQDEGSYLRKWDEFGNTEGELFLKRARAVGAISFFNPVENKDGTVTVTCDRLTSEQIKELKAVSELDATDKLSEFLSNPEMSFFEYAKGVVPDADVSLGISGKQVESSKEKPLTLPVVEFDEGRQQITFKSEASPNKAWLVYSVAGEIAQIKRRMEARKRIQTGRAANPDLGLLIEEGGQIPPRRASPKMKPLTAFVKKKVFKNDATYMQERAIEVALNTPDIALIQGPPGTGKTTVIAAIIERLNEEADKRGDIRGKILLSGFQHDAVENMIGRIALNSLPVPKFGKRSGENEDTESRFERDLQAWCEDKVKKIRKKNPQIAEALSERELRNQCIQYIEAPTLALAVALVNTAAETPERTLDASLRQRLVETKEMLITEQNRQTTANSNLRVVRALRVTEVSFADDGPARAADLLHDDALNSELEDADKAILAEAARWRESGEPPFLAKLQALKRDLLTRFCPAPVFFVEKPRDVVIKLIQETINALHVRGRSARDKKTAALAELLLEMENNPSDIMEAVVDYCFAFAATCQQSVNKEMQKMKGIYPNSPGPQSMEYDYVIVDEAARVSPRDLMIPMAQGKRIILVGDHRQLPQLIDEEVAKKMEEGNEAAGEESAWLKKSMFEYLFTERLGKLEKSDGIKRCVTLDKQYRMHPVLGDFISRNFYERFNTEEKFDSDLPESVFAHNLPRTNGACAAWMDVPLQKGEMQRAGTSWMRPVEADAICKNLKEWMACSANENLSFGVIAFYKAQTEHIKKQLGGKFLGTAGDRLRIGTVDSFQGMEFDVVFLSLVRTRGFGFLQLCNRLNVSMSRQKKLLVAVGDACFFDSADAREKVPGLADFLKLCKDKGVML